MSGTHTTTRDGTGNGAAAPWRARVLTLYPEMFPGALGQALAGRALKEGVWMLESVDIRDFASDKHRSVDDEPFGGGPGMVMRADILAAAIDATHPAESSDALIYLSPRGRLLDQNRARELADGTGVTLVCGRFEGGDDRVLDARDRRPTDPGHRGEVFGSAERFPHRPVGHDLGRG